MAKTYEASTCTIWRLLMRYVLFFVFIGTFIKGLAYDMLIYIGVLDVVCVHSAV